MKPPFSHRDLKIIQEGNRRHQDVMDLLREVKRLRNLLALTYSVLSKIPMRDLGMEIEDIIALFDALYAEPSIQEYQRMDNKRQDMEFRRKKAQEAYDVRQNQTGPKSE